MPPKFIFVRHGEALHNVAFHKEGENIEVFTRAEFKDAPLSEAGIEQAKKVGEELAKLNIIDLWSSPLTRALQTSMEIFEEATIHNLYMHDSLLEFLGGNQPCNERKTRAEIEKEYSYWDTKFLPDLPPYWARAEPLSIVHHRMKTFVLWLAHVYKDQPDSYHIVIVSHKNAILALTGKDLKNAEYVILGVDELK